MKELTEVHKQNMKIQLNLMETIERLTNQMIELSEKKFEHEVGNLLLPMSIKE